MKTHYAVLGVKPVATTAEIRQAYLRLAAEHHPDRGGDRRKFEAANLAYKTLSNLSARTTYDARLNMEGRICRACKGHGEVVKTKSFTTTYKQTCLACGGSGEGANSAD